MLVLVSSASAAVDKVICVPWQGNITKFHTAIDSQTIRLKGVIKTTDTTMVWYKWVYGDGAESSVYALSGKTKYNVESDHTYSGAAGTPFTAQLLVDHVDSSMANAIADSYLVKIEENNLDARINIAIDNGLWYLYKSGSDGSSYYHTFDGSPFMVWSYGSYFASPTASVMHAFEINGHKETGDPDQDPYAEYVDWGLNWLFNGWYYQNQYPMLRPYTIGMTGLGDNPDSRANETGIEVRDYGYRPVYEGGMVMDAIIASGTPDADCGRDFDGDGLNETYREVLQDMVDMYAWGQYDDARYGGWRYGWNSWPDNSACQWAAIGMLPAQEPPWDCNVPEWVKTYNDNWLDYSHSNPWWAHPEWGGFGYTSPSWGDALTPSGMVQLCFVGATTSDSRWVDCERWFADNWKDVGRDWLDKHNVYGYYSFAKAMRLALPAPVVTFSHNNFDWYRGDGTTMGLAEKISDRLIAAHNWNYFGPTLGTAWCVIILKPVLFAEAPVPCFDADPNPSYPDLPINFDPFCSTHSEPGKDIGNIVLFEWDWDNDGVYDESTTTPDVVTHAFACASIPCTYPVTLRVTDDSDPCRTATYVQNINITNPPHPPVARAKDIYMVSLCEGDTLVLDGNDSYDPDEGEHEDGCPACPNDTITAYEWDLNGAPWDYTDETGPVLDLGSGYTSYFGTAGIYNVGLRVTDNTAAAYPTSGEPNLTDEDFAVVEVYDGCICEVSATPLCLAIQLEWDDIGADMYYIYRSFVGPNLGFQDIGRTTDTMKIAGSFVMEKPHWYRIMAETGDYRCLSKAVAVTAESSLCNPTADPDGPYSGCYPDDTITLDGSGSIALAGTIVAWDWDLDGDGEYDDAFGETVDWTPASEGLYTIGLRVTSSDSLVLVDEGSTTAQIELCNQPPIAVCQDVTVVASGDCLGVVVPADVDNGSFDPDGDPITLSLSPPGPYPIGTTEVTLTVTDDKGASDSCLATVTVVTAEALTYDGDTLISTGGSPTAEVSLVATLRDGAGAAMDIDGEQVTFTLNAEGVGTIVVTADSLDGVAQALQTLEPAIYLVEITTACSNVTASAILVIYNPDGGFATGGGWIVPLADGLNTYPNQRANFGFNAKYKKGSPTGHIEFRYSDGYIDLKSSSIEQLVITGGMIAQFKGWASVNGTEGYWFFVKAIDNGEPGTNDTFDIKIWAPGADTEGNPSERAGGVLQGGNIVVHTKGKK
jgi:hypothetical protein